MITELGIDSGTGSNSCTTCSGGWQSFTDYWASNGGSTNGDHEYIWQLQWYDSLMLQDDYVIGGTIYCIEIPGWDTFQLTQGAVDDLITYMTSLGKQQPRTGSE